MGLEILTKMTPADLFSDSYFAARQRLVELAGDMGWELESHAIPAGSSTAADLFMDSVISPVARPRKTVIISSGVHGVEGFLGSAVQLGILRAGRESVLPAGQGVRIVLLHAVNPCGFANLRRGNEANIDLNRNFLREGESYSGSPPLYALLNPLLNPSSPPRRHDFFAMRVIGYVLRHGWAPLKQAVAGGQYEFPKGLFYGGVAPSRSMEILNAHLESWIGGAEEVVHVDFHSGLGKRETYKLLVDYEASAVRRNRLNQLFGPDEIEWANAGSTAYPTRGSLGQWCAWRFPQTNYLYVAAEFGTYGPLKMLAALRRENQAYHWAKAEDPATVRAKAELKEAFIPKDKRWREVVVRQGMKLVKQAMALP